MRRVTTLEERIRIMEWAEAGLADKTIAQRLGWSQGTVRKWRRRGQRQGRAGLVSEVGRPPKGRRVQKPHLDGYARDRGLRWIPRLQK